MRKSLTIASLVAALAAAATSAGAATVYTDSSAFQSALSTHAFDNFNDLAYGQIQGASYSRGLVNGYQVTHSASNGLYSNPASMSVNTASSELLLTFNSANVYAVGGTFFGGNMAGTPIPANVTITLSDSTVVNFTGNPTFYGFTSASPIASLSIASTTATTSSQFAWPSVDDLYYGDFSARLQVNPNDGTAVPTPAAAAAALPLLGLLAAKRRRPQA
jgi:hypothetical protein